MTPQEAIQALESFSWLSSGVSSQDMIVFKGQSHSLHKVLRMVIDVAREHLRPPPPAALDWIQVCDERGNTVWTADSSLTVVSREGADFAEWSLSQELSNDSIRWRLFADNELCVYYMHSVLPWMSLPLENVNFDSVFGRVFPSLDEAINYAEKLNSRVTECLNRDQKKPEPEPVTAPVAESFMYPG